MGRVFITGDTHGRYDFLKLKQYKWPQGISKDDYLIIAGDFGGVWGGIIDLVKLEKEQGCYLGADKNPTLDKDAYTLLEYQHLPCTVLFIDGNHENFDALKKYKVEEWNGGKVQFIRPDIIHLMRGQCYTLFGKKFFTMGGATSVDKWYRKEHISWWKEELPTKEECDIALDTLDKNDWSVDYVITHAAPNKILSQIDATFEHDMITNFLFTIDMDLKFKDWYFGHYHIDEDFSKNDKDDEPIKYHCLYDRIIELDMK